jgi:DNA-binding CsgD family transcriptional regulator
MVGLMFDVLLAQLLSHSSMVSQRAEGVAFFRVAKDLYRLASVTYLCVNIPGSVHRKGYVHCVYSDTCVKQFVSQGRVQLDFTNQPALPYRESRDSRGSSAIDEKIGLEKLRGVTFSLPQRLGETAIFGITAETDLSEWRATQSLITRECQILANYFHSHVLRINGHNCEREILISARELDCLKWTAEGKTAWEASIILGISERTVRFHLNAAREKLKCTTTTQAVAKAIVNQLIEV